jgi:hypothetical protein
MPAPRAGDDDHRMRIHAELTVIDGEVLCPVSGERRNVETCERCRDFEQVGPGTPSETCVHCTPDVESLPSAIDRLTRA